MMKQAKPGLFMILLLAAAESLPGPAYADQRACTGKPVDVFADPSEFVVALDIQGDCGTTFFTIQRDLYPDKTARANYKEVTALILTAVGTGGSLTFFAGRSSFLCSDGRHIADHVGLHVRGHASGCWDSN